MILIKLLAQLIFKLKGWKVVGELPPKPRKFIMVIAPHTSKWDVVYALGAAATVGLEIRFLVNKLEMKHIQGWAMRAFGAIPIDKVKNEGVVQKVAELFNTRQELVLCLNPEGGLPKCDDFRTGFFHMAMAANVPLLVSYFDYPSKTIGIGQFYTLTGDMDKDFDYLWDFYKTKTGKYPDLGIFGNRKPKEKNKTPLVESSLER